MICGIEIILLILVIKFGWLKSKEINSQCTCLRDQDDILAIGIPPPAG